MNTPQPHPQIDVYLAPIQRDGTGKREEERRALELLLQSDTITQLPSHITKVSHRPDGAPLLPESLGLGISISHSEHILAVALYPSHMRIGIDIEERAEKVAQLIERVTRTSEIELLKEYQLPPILLWSAKEAAFKAFSDQLTTMSEQILLVDCMPERQLLLLNITTNDDISFEAEVTYMMSHFGVRKEGADERIPYTFALACQPSCPHFCLHEASYF